MRRITFILLLLLVAVAAVAQETTNKPAEAKPRNDFTWARAPYRLDYVVKELDDNKVVNTRSYSLSMQSSEERGRSFGELKAGSRVPVVTMAFPSGQPAVPSTQYMDVGINIRSQLYLLENSNLLLDSTVEISNLATGPGAEGPSGNPIVRSIRANTTSEVTANKSNQIAIVDDPTSKHRFEIDVTPTKLR